MSKLRVSSTNLCGVFVPTAVNLHGPLCELRQVPEYRANALASGELEDVRGKVRSFAQTHCGKCHIASLPTAVPGALRIYNLDAADWSSTLTAAQLRNGFPRRLDPLLDAGGKQTLRAFIEAELALRP